MKNRFEVLAWVSLITSLIATLAGCDRDPARDVKILDRPSVQEKNVKVPPLAPWHPRYCPPPADYDHGPSAVQLKGPCPLNFKAEVLCHSEGDDFYVSLQTKDRSPSQFALNFNVEGYHGPGAYEETQVSLWIREGEKIFRWYRWSNDNVASIVNPDEKSLTVKSAILTGEPLVSSCSRIPGRRLNFKYDCEGMPESPTAIESTQFEISGVFKCVQDKKEE